MTLIKSISGIRGTIGGGIGDTLNPLDIVKFTSAYATFIRQSMPAATRSLWVAMHVFQARWLRTWCVVRSWVWASMS